MDSPRGRSLIRFSLRSHRAGALANGLGFGLLAAIMAPAYIAAADAVAGGLTVLAQQAGPIAKSFEFLTGPVDRLDTVGGYLSYKIYPDIALLLAIYAAMQGAQVLRGAETRGLFDLWFANGRTRSQIIRDRLVGFTLMLTLSIVLIYAGTALGGALAKESLAGNAVGQCLALELTALAAFGFGFLLSQFFDSARTASGISAGYLVAAFFVANMAGSLGALTPLRYASPFYYYIANRTLVEGIAVDWPALAVLLLFFALSTAIAWRLLLLRDVGGVIGARIRPTRETSYAVSLRRFSHRWLWLHWISEQRIGLSAWCIAAGLFTGVESGVVPTAIRLVNDNASGALKQLLERHHTLLTTDQYLSFFISFAAVIAAGFAIAQVSRWAGDASQRRTDVVLSQPISMWRLTVERALSFLAGASLLAVAMMVGVWVGALVGGYSVQVAGLIRAAVVVVMIAAAVAGVGAVVVTWFRSAVATFSVSAVVVAMFFLTAIAALLSWPAWTLRISLFDAFATPYMEWPDAGRLVYMLAVALVGPLLAYVLMRQGARIAA